MKELLIAFSKFKAECPKIERSRKVEFLKTKYAYAEFDKILAKVNPLLQKNGLCLTEQMDGPSITTTLHHIETGQKMESHITIPELSLQGMNVAQSTGSAITYFRRYNLITILGLATEQDTDGKPGRPSAGKKDTKPPYERQIPMPKPWLNPGTEQWRNAVKAMKEGKKIGEIEEHYRISKNNREQLITDALT